MCGSLGRVLNCRNCHFPTALYHSDISKYWAQGSEDDFPGELKGSKVKPALAMEVYILPQLSLPLVSMYCAIGVVYYC